jgi:uncharacterized surface protein with fasciclin (FAS1) repeats
MNKLFKPLSWMTVLLLSFTIVSCSDDDDAPVVSTPPMEEEMPPPVEPTSNIVELAIASESLTQLEAAVIKADLVGTLSGDGPFTVFAPTDEAFVALLGALGDDYNSLDDFDTEGEIELLTNILLYHVVPAEVKAADLAAGDVATALADNSVSVISSGSTFVIGDASSTDANITATDIEATNGVVHLIDKVLLPQAAVDFVASLQDLVDVASANPDFSVLVDAVVKTDLVATLQGEGPLTVFAPNNDAFVALLGALGSNYNSLDDFDTEGEIALLKNILLYHVLPAQVNAADLMAGDVGTAFTDNSIAVIESGETFVIGDASETDAGILAADVGANNGVIHVIDKVLLPQAAIDFVNSLQDIVGIASSNDDFSILVDAVIKTDLVETLQSEGPFTVFAPTNDAFAALLDVLGDDYNNLDDFDTEGEIELLKNILLYHVVPAQVKSTDLAAGDVATAFAENSISVVMSGDTFAIGDASGVDANLAVIDLEATNGVVHVIDKVLLPQAALDFVSSL